MSEYLSLSKALAENRLADFVTQAEAESIGPADRSQFEAMVGRITALLPEDQTSRLRGSGSSRGK